MTTRVPSIPRSTKPKRAPASARKTTTDRPPPESAALRDRVATRESTFVDGPLSDDQLAEELGEGAVLAMTSGQDEWQPSSDAEGDAEAGGLSMDTMDTGLDLELDFDEPSFHGRTTGLSHRRA